ncbi:MAG: hypothetical protein RL386_77 [Bacteroidota bacterium]|jgi:hypothetical protein
MRKTLKIIILLLFVKIYLPSCSPKVNCPSAKGLSAPVNRKGELITTRGKSSLFSTKEMRRLGKR